MQTSKPVAGARRARALGWLGLWCLLGATCMPMRAAANAWIFLDNPKPGAFVYLDNRSQQLASVKWSGSNFDAVEGAGGSLWVLDPAQMKFFHYAATGKLLGEYAVPADDKDGNLGPMAVDVDGNLWLGGSLIPGSDNPFAGMPDDQGRNFIAKYSNAGRLLFDNATGNWGPNRLLAAKGGGVWAPYGNGASYGDGVLRISAAGQVTGNYSIPGVPACNAIFFCIATTDPTGNLWFDDIQPGGVEDLPIVTNVYGADGELLHAYPDVDAQGRPSPGRDAVVFTSTGARWTALASGSSIIVADAQGHVLGELNQHHDPTGTWFCAMAADAHDHVWVATTNLAQTKTWIDVYDAGADRVSATTEQGGACTIIAAHPGF